MTQELRDSTLMREVSAVINSGSNPVHYQLDAWIVANGQTIKCLQVVSIDLERDYVGRYHDAPIMQVLMQRGQFFTAIYPYADALTLILRQTPIGEVSQAVDNTQGVQQETFVAILHQQGSPYLEGNHNFTLSETTLDLTDLHVVNIELIPEAAHQLRMLGASPGVLRACTPEQALRTILTKESQQVQVQQTKLITGVDVVPSNNQKVRQHVVVPHGLMLADIPNWIQQQQGGLYSAGLGYYLQGSVWYVYPLYDPIRNSQQAPTLTIINVPRNQFVGIERTYATVGGHTTLLVTGDVKYVDQSPQRQLNQGSGRRWTDADQLMSGNYIATANNKSVAFRAKTNYEVLTAPRPDGMNLAPVASGATSNPYQQYEQLAKNNGALYAFSWTNSDPNLVTPGIRVRVLYLNQGQVASVQGVILKTKHYRRMAGKGFANGRYITDSGLVVFAQRATGNGLVTPGTVDPMPSSTN